MGKCYQMSSRMFDLPEWVNLLEFGMEFWSLWFQVQVHFVTVFGYIALLILLLPVSIILVFSQLWSTTWFLWCSYLLYIQYTWLFTFFFDKLPIYEIIYFHFRFWISFLQSKTLVEGNGVMVADWTVEIFP